MTGTMLPLRVSAYTVTSALGHGRSATQTCIDERRSGLEPNAFTQSPLETWIGRVPGLEDAALPPALARWECRNNRLAWQALAGDDFLAAVAAARDRYGAPRIAVVVGTSTSSIGASEEAYCRLDPDGRYPEDLRRPIVHTPHSLGDFVQQALGLEGMAVTVATACSSSAKVFCQAERLIRAGLADAVVAGGVDTLCGSVLYGFNSLELTSPEPCRPFDQSRRGISLGEAGGFALLEPGDGAGPWFVGYGESSDAYHMSSPHPEGLGVRLAIAAALARAEIDPAAVGYINLHGTATRRNDEVEASVVRELFPATTRASSTKGWTGHALGAAGILEAAISLMALDSGRLPGTLNTRNLDPACGEQIMLDNERADIAVALSHSFGFGGSNCVLAFARERWH